MGGLGEDSAKFFLRQIIDVVGFIHEEHVAHRDIKLENMLLDDEMNLKLLDFGLASQKNIEALTAMVGTDQYMPPEIR